MKFVLEALGLTAGGGKAGLMRLLPSLAEQGAGHSFVAIVADRPEFAPLARPNLKLIVRNKPASLLVRHLVLQRTVPRICAAERADALLCMGNFGPLRCPIPTVVMLHNARYLCGHSAGLGMTLRERLIDGYGRRNLRRLSGTARFIVQTELMKKRLLAPFGLPEARVVVIPDGDGLPAHFRTPEGAARKAANTGDAPFTFLCLARYYPHKNLEVLVDAMKLLAARESSRARCLLTISADQHPGAKRLLKRIAAERLQHALVNLGPLDESAVAAAYASADAFLLPTLIESLGRTYLEAMRFGLPILTSDRDFALDACGAAAVYFDPLDPGSVAAALARVMNDENLRARLAAEGRSRAKVSNFWTLIAGRFLAELERAATGQTPGPTPAAMAPEGRSGAPLAFGGQARAWGQEGA
jgi:glycosyltransferase involved in cell wall biosynthesis